MSEECSKILFLIADNPSGTQQILASFYNPKFDPLIWHMNRNRFKTTP